MQMRGGTRRPWVSGGFRIALRFAIIRAERRTEVSATERFFVAVEQSNDLVSDQTAFDALCGVWREAGRFAFDTEFIRDDTYDAILCVVQVTTGDSVTLVDPTEGLDLAPFWELVTDPGIQTIVHAGKEDFEVCLTACGEPPRNVFDVQIAAGFLGYGYPLNLVRLVDQVVGRKISKGQTLTDWLRRPLTAQQFKYAVDDVLYLPDICGRLERDLVAKGRIAWAREEFARFEDPATYQPPARDRLAKLKGASKLDGLGLLVLERLVEWRDGWAKKQNRPVRAMMRDDVMVEIAKQRPSEGSDLQVMRGFHQSRHKPTVDDILNVIRQAQAVPRSDWPKPRKRPERSPMFKATVDLLSAYTRAACHDQGVSSDLFGSAQRLRELMDYLQNGTADRPVLLNGWREDFIGRRLVDLLNGRTELYLSGWPDAPRLEVGDRSDGNDASSSKQQPSPSHETMNDERA